ncbi:MAG: aspartate aminotransferase family protein [Patescibacteria group bacterium]|jgi:acetylornithine/succinyldiaminopimelate/putrescine aminotransferase
MIENSIVYRDFKGKYEYLPLAKAEVSLIWDRSGKRYIDFSSAWNVTNLGWNHPEVNEAIIEQVKKNVQGLLWGSDPIQEEYAKALTDVLPKELNACIKETSGTESVEVAIKVARVYTGRSKIIGFNSQYHGQLFATLAIGYPKGSHSKLEPLVPEIAPIAFPHNKISVADWQKFLLDFEEILIEKDVAAVVTEPGIITGWGSTLIAYPGFLTKLRELTLKYGTLLIVDEVGTGFSRTGKLFGIQHENVLPDMVALAKGISNGASAIGAVVGKSEIFEKSFSESILVSTFGWNPIACAASLKVLQIHLRDKTWEMAEEKGNYIKEKLKAHIGETLVDVRGIGLEIGAQFKDAETCSRIQKACFADGLHVVVGSKDNMQIMPPLIIPQELLDEGLDILIKNLK